MAGSNGKPPKPRLSDPGSTPRIGFGGSIDRGRPVYEEKGGSPEEPWSVSVVPLEGAGGLGAQLGGGRLKPRAVFEVRADFYGLGLKEFGSVPGTHRIETFNTEELEFARAIAVEATELLRQGERDLLMNVLAERRRRR